MHLCFPVQRRVPGSVHWEMAPNNKQSKAECDTVSRLSAATPTWCVCFGAIVVMHHPVARVLAATKGRSRALQPLMTLAGRVLLFAHYAGLSTSMARQRAWIVALNGHNAWPRCTTALKPCECSTSRVSDICKRQIRFRESLRWTQSWLQPHLSLQIPLY